MRRNTLRNLSPKRGMFVAAVSLALVLGLSASAVASDYRQSDRPSPADAPSSRHGDHDNGPKPTVVLVHGAWADASSWNPVVDDLASRGYTVLAPPNPLRGLASDATYLQSFLSTISGPIILVGHSYGGAVITNAAVGNPNVKALVYVAAFAPDQGESLASIEAMNPGSELGPSTLTFRPYPLAGGGQSLDAYITPSVFHEVFASDLSSRQTTEMAATQRPIDASVLGEPSGPPAWASIPSWYLVAANDHAIPAATELFMAKRAHSHTIEIDSSHVAMLSHPDVVTRLILAAAESSR